MRTLVTILSILGTFVAPIQALVLLVVAFVALDTITGIYAVVKVKGRKHFRSGHLFNIVPKTLMYSSTILLSFMVDKFIFGGTLFGIKMLLAKVSSALWVYVESKSIDENSQKLGNRPVWDILKELMGKAKSAKKDINDLCQ